MFGIFPDVDRLSLKKASAGAQSSAVAQANKSSTRSPYVPWRAAARAERQR